MQRSLLCIVLRLRLESMPLIGVDVRLTGKIGLNTQLQELLRIDDWDVGVVFAMKKQERRHADEIVIVRIRQAAIELDDSVGALALAAERERDGCAERVADDEHGRRVAGFRPVQHLANGADPRRVIFIGTGLAVPRVHIVGELDTIAVLRKKFRLLAIKGGRPPDPVQENDERQISGCAEVLHRYAFLSCGCCRRGRRRGAHLHSVPLGNLPRKRSAPLLRIVSAVARPSLRAQPGIVSRSAVCVIDQRR